SGVHEMPVTLVTPSRRQFLRTVAGGAMVFASGVTASAGSFLRDDIDADLVYLLNDTHIGEKHPPDSAVPSHLRQAVDEILKLERRPAAVIINGDLALKDGQPGDYRHLGQLINPLQEAGIALHLTLGNHDNRDVFYQVLADQRPESPPIASRHITVVQTRHANFFLLDSLHETMVTPGTLGTEQLAWLAKSLDAHPDRPAIIVTHHNPRLGGDPNHFPGGLTDSEDLWQLLAPRAHVKAYLHGHIHDRSQATHQGIHILNTPATSYVANRETSTTGWTIARLSATGVSLTTRTTETDHPWNGQVQEVAWRA
ncbi:MAG: metallophosphoesterase, partial [Planctomycetaceae bacterium]|nr:metallophosphoesterase [Planctomycetaceae bacterium]